jgi:hypothetical protein
VKQVVIENPIINAPFDEPTRHFRFTDQGRSLGRENEHSGFSRREKQEITSLRFW